MVKVSKQNEKTPQNMQAQFLVGIKVPSIESSHIRTKKFIT